MKNKLLRTLSAFMSLVLLFNLAISSSAASKSELQDQLADIQAEREEKQELLDSMKGDLDKQEEYVTTLYSQIEAIQAEIDIYQIKINELNAEVEGINAKIEAKNEEIAEIEVQMVDQKAEIEEVKAMLAVRMRASYMAGSGSTLKLLLSADNLASYLTTSELLKRIADNDDKIIKSLIKKIEDLLKLQEELEKQKEELQIKMGHMDDLITSLSGGNQQKVVLAKWLMAGPKVLILDNPTQGVDVGAKEEIYSIIHRLAQDGVAIVVLSSEAQEIIRICDRSIVLFHGRQTGLVEGDEMNERNIMYLATGGSQETKERV